MILPPYDIISKLVLRRRKLNLTQQQVADRIGTTRSAVARWEVGLINPSYESLMRWIAALEYRVVFEET